MRRLILIIIFLIIALGVWNWLSISIPELSKLLQVPNKFIETPSENVRVLTEESVVIDAVKKVGPSVVTIAQEASSRSRNFNFGPFSTFDIPQENPNEPRGIGTGFIVSSDGLIITSKHVVSETGVKYQVITADDKKLDVQRVYRDPLNDVAIIKVNPPAGGLIPVELGDSSKLQVGQFVIAIGTALGEFRSTVTTGVISGLGRGITAGSAFEGFIERLDNVIQTDAAINPGNSGGPLLNSSSQVIGVNTAIASEGQNIGFALPINVVKNSIKNFNENGQFDRPFLGVSYRSLSRDAAILNDIPEGAYVQSVVEASPAEKSRIQEGDIIVSIDGIRINEKNDLAVVIASKKIGSTIKISLWRDGQTVEVNATLVAAPDQ